MLIGKYSYFILKYLLLLLLGSIMHLNLLEICRRKKRFCQETNISLQNNVRLENYRHSVVFETQIIFGIINILDIFIRDHRVASNIKCQWKEIY